MSLCATGLELYRRISERNRPPEAFEERLQASLGAWRKYEAHVKECPQCGARQEIAA